MDVVLALCQARLCLSVFYIVDGGVKLYPLKLLTCKLVCNIDEERVYKIRYTCEI